MLKALSSKDFKKQIDLLIAESDIRQNRVSSRHFQRVRQKVSCFIKVNWQWITKYKADWYQLKYQMTNYLHFSHDDECVKKIRVIKVVCSDGTLKLALASLQVFDNTKKINDQEYIYFKESIARIYEGIKLNKANNYIPCDTREWYDLHTPV